MTLKRVLVYVVISFAAYQLVNFLQKDEVKTPPKKSEPIVYFKDEKAIRDLLAQEQKVKEVLLKDTGFIYVGTYSDSTNRDGYAQYLCTLLQPHISNVTVKIVDYKDVLQKKGFTELGIAKCKP
jgi:hypothetical protein